MMTTFKERPILFSAPMVRALLAGTKTQTRRVARLREIYVGYPLLASEMAHKIPLPSCPYGQPGDRLWVRETWAAPHDCDHLKPREVPPGTRVHYAADASLGGLLGRPSIFMPRWASRITLEVTGVRVERLQDISDADAIAEGIGTTNGGFGLPDGSHFHAADPRISYWSLCDAINGAGSVEANPWVWVVEFKAAEQRSQSQSAADA